jgi:hypothetical protein
VDLDPQTPLHSPHRSVIGLTLRTALDNLPGDRATETTVRDVLEVMRPHVEEWLEAADIAGRLGDSDRGVHVVLSTLAEGHVVRRDGERFCYPHDPIVDIDVQRFLSRARHHNRLVQDNLAKFRDRFGSR